MRSSRPVLFAYRSRPKPSTGTRISPVKTTAPPQHAASIDVTASPTHPKATHFTVPSSASRFGFTISLLIHLGLFLFGIFYVIDQHVAEESYVNVDVVHRKLPPKVRRRAMPRVLAVPSPRVTPSIAPRTPRFAATAASIPVVIGEPMLPPLTPPTLDEELNPTDAAGWEGLGRQSILPPHVVENFRPDISLFSAEPPKLEIATEVKGIDTAPLELEALDEISPAVGLQQVTRLPRFIHKVIPRYPELAKRAGKEGVVILEAEIGPDGTARDITVIQGMGYGCDEAAIAALRASRFFPAYRGDQPVSVRIQIPYRFKFEEM